MPVTKQIKKRSKKMTPTLRRLPATLLMLILSWIACTITQASERPENPQWDRKPPDAIAPAQDENAPGLLLRLTMGGVAQSSMENQEAAYTLGCSALELGAGPVSASFKWLGFSWDRPGEYGVDTNGRDPWGSLYEVAVGATHGGLISEHLSYALMLGAASSHEKETDDSFSFNGGGYGMYAINPKWRITAGALYSKHQRVESDFEIIPVLSVSWNTKPTSGPSFTIGLPTTELTWNFSQTTSLTLDTSGFESGIYRLADNSPVREKGYVEFSGTTCTLRIETLLANRISLSAGLSQALSRKHKLYDHQGKNEIRYEVEKTPGCFLSLSMPF